MCFITVFAAGYFTGIPDPSPISHGAAGSDVRIAGEGFGLAATLARDGKGASSGLDGPPAGKLEDQMAELLDELKGKSRCVYYMAQLRTGWLLSLGDSILARSDKEDVLALTDNWDT